VHHEEGHFSAVEGLELYWQRWLPETAPKVAVLLVHGVGEHSGRYMNVVNPLVAAGFSVHTYDQRGHGRSSGARVHIDSWSQYREDLDAYVQLVREREPGCPLVVYGHSMGSLVVLDYLLTTSQEFAGALISGVATEPVGVGSPALIAMAKALTRIAPRHYVDLGINPASLTRDSAACESFATDPLNCGRATVRWGTESLATVDRVKADMNRLGLPLLVVHGGADPLNAPSGARALFSAARCAGTTLHIYDDVLHEPHNDLGHEQLAADILEWLNKRVQAPAAATTWRVERIEELKIVALTFSGDVAGSDLIDASREVIRRLAEHGASDVLGDFSAVETLTTSNFTLLDLIEDVYVAEGVDRATRIALLPPHASDSAESVRFYETACRNRGWRARVFETREAALVWLRG
jgi:alpha-beta hydrolase superfamily lysophospholipase